MDGIFLAYDRLHTLHKRHFHMHENSRMRLMDIMNKINVQEQYPANPEAAADAIAKCGRQLAEALAKAVLQDRGLLDPKVTTLGRLVAPVCTFDQKLAACLERLCVCVNAECHDSDSSLPPHMLINSVASCSALAFDTAAQHVPGGRGSAAQANQ
ncbi:hypothetical protein FOA52_007161 [Chlamydomonas sp. UWO 241]|nr:hypothetical protein FOA52_007161 [Chlamydomonas sp. UWO 241]